MASFPEIPDIKLSKPRNTFRLVRLRADTYTPNISDVNEGLTLEWIERLAAPFGTGTDLVNTTFINSTKGYGRFNDNKNGAWYCA